MNNLSFSRARVCVCVYAPPPCSQICVFHCTLSVVDGRDGWQWKVGEVVDIVLRVGGDGTVVLCLGEGERS